VRIKSEFFKGITPELFLEAIRRIDLGYISKFADSTKLDILNVRA
jgi:hypothetical protein